MRRAHRTATHRSRPLPAAVWVSLAIVVLALLTVIAVPAWSAAQNAGPSPDAARQPSGQPQVSTAPTLSPQATVSPRPSASPQRTVSPQPSAGARDEASDEATAALALLVDVREVSGTSAAPYSRDAFGQAWYDADRNGCDTRNDMLRRDLTDTTLKADTNGCKVLTGTLVDPYSGETVGFVSGTDTSVLVQIDHIIPLSWAWHHGAENWSAEELREFANSPDNLLATIGSINQSKSDSGPDKWLPPAEAVHCTYIAGYVELIAEWDLGVTGSERAFFERALAEC